MTSSLRYGLIGCGSMGREHIENIRALRSGTITACPGWLQPASRQRRG